MKKETKQPKTVKREKPEDLHGRQIVKAPSDNPKKLLAEGMKWRAGRKKMALAHAKERATAMKRTSGKLTADIQG